MILEQHESLCTHLYSPTRWNLNFIITFHSSLRNSHCNSCSLECGNKSDGMMDTKDDLQARKGASLARCRTITVTKKL